MSDFTVRSDSVDVEQIMRQIRARIREKRGVDYTEEEIRELANVKLETFLDPRGVRSDLLAQFRLKRDASTSPRNFAFENTTLYESSRPFLRWMRKVLNPILKLFFNPNPIVDALHIQSKLNDSYNHSESLYYELIHNLVLETTRLGIEVKNLKMRVESMSSRLDFDERRARALEGVVQYRPGAVPPLQPPRIGRRTCVHRRRISRTSGAAATPERPPAARDGTRRTSEGGDRSAGPQGQAARAEAPRENESREHHAPEPSPSGRRADRSPRFRSVVKLAVVVQRYGADINGGAELHARYIAERLSRHAEVEVVTTCARDYVTWKNELPPGVEEINARPREAVSGQQGTEPDRLRPPVPARFRSAAHRRRRDRVARQRRDLQAPR